MQQNMIDLNFLSIRNEKYWMLSTFCSEQYRLQWSRYFPLLHRVCTSDKRGFFFSLLLRQYPGVSFDAFCFRTRSFQLGIIFFSGFLSPCTRDSWPVFTDVEVFEEKKNRLLCEHETVFDAVQEEFASKSHWDSIHCEARRKENKSRVNKRGG